MIRKLKVFKLSWLVIQAAITLYLPKNQIQNHETSAGSKDSTVTSFSQFGIWLLAIGVVEYRSKSSVPAGTGGHLKQQYKSLEKCLKVVHVAKASSYLYVLEEGHSEYSKDEHDQEQKQADIEKRR